MPGGITGRDGEYRIGLSDAEAIIKWWKKSYAGVKSKVPMEITLRKYVPKGLDKKQSELKSEYYLELYRGEWDELPRMKERHKMVAEAYESIKNGFKSDVFDGGHVVFTEIFAYKILPENE